MASGYSKVTLIGNTTRDVELRQTGGGTSVADIGLAVNDRVKKDGKWTDEVTFVDVTLWGKTAEVAAEYVTKGKQLFIEGRLKLDTWEKDGQKRSKHYVVCDRMILLGGGGGKPQTDNSGESQATQTTPDEDIPF